MAFAPPSKVKASSNLAKSTWTPMNHPEANLQVFEERRQIIQKWFQKWQDTQKRIIVNDILKNLSNKHLVSLHETLNGKFPQERHDFTRILPRVLTLYLFSFLDPRTLCRCAQVSWYWNYLTEMDCLWRPKCLKFGWYPTYQPSPFEEKIWKRFYVSTVHELNYVKMKAIENKHESERPDTARTNASRLSVARSTTSSVSGLKKGPTVPSTKKPLLAPKWQPPPWKGSDPHPVDTVRYNYLGNSKRKKKNMSPSGRPSSKHEGRPQSALGKSREYKHDDAAIASSRRTSHDQRNGEKSYDLPLDKTSHLSGGARASFSGGNAGSHPHLNKDFQLPHYKGSDPSSTPHPGKSGTANSTLQYGTGYPSITSQINWNPQSTTNSVTELRSQSLALDQSNPGNGTKMLSSEELSRMSIDAGERLTASSVSQVTIASTTSSFMTLPLETGVRPQPVMKSSPEKLKRGKEINVALEKKVTVEDQIRATSNTGDLKGRGWSAPTNSNSDDEF